MSIYWERPEYLVGFATRKNGRKVCEGGRRPAPLPKKLARCSARQMPRRLAAGIGRVDKFICYRGQIGLFCSFLLTKRLFHKNSFGRTRMPTTDSDGIIRNVKVLGKEFA